MRHAYIAVWLMLVAAPAAAQQLVQLVAKGAANAGTISANGGSVTFDSSGMASVRIQTLDTYSGTWEVQCSVDGGTTFDTDDEVSLVLEGTTTPVASVTDTVGIWSAAVAGCSRIKIVATAGFAATDVTFAIQSIQSGGSSGGGGGGASGNVTIVEGADTADVNASGQLSVTCANCSGSGVSVNEDVASADGHAGTPAYSVRNNTLTGATSADGDYQPLKSTAAGALYVNPAYGDTVAAAGAGAVTSATPRTVTASDSPDVTSLGLIDNAVGTVAAGTAATGSILGGLIYNSSPITLTNTQGAALQGDANGYLKVNVAAGTTSGALDTDDGSIATGQSVNLNAVMPYGYNATAAAWQRAGLAVTDSPAPTNGQLAMGNGSTATPTAVTDGDSQAIWLDTVGRVHLVTEAAEDSASADAQIGQRMLAVRDDTLDARSGTEGDFEWLHTNANGALWAIDVNSAAMLTSAQLMDNSVGTVAAGTAATGSLLTGGIYNSTPITLTNGQGSASQFDSNGYLKVNIAAGASAGGTSLADGATFTPNTTSLTPMGGMYESSVTACVSGDACIPGLTAQRTQKVTLFSAAGTELTAAVDQTVGSAFGTTGPGIMAQFKDFTGSAAISTTANVDTAAEATPVAATLQGIQYGFLTNEDGSKQIGKLEDDAHATADYAMPVLTRRIDTPATSAGSSGDYATLDSSAEGAAYTTQIATTGGGATMIAFTSAASTNSTSVKASAGNLYGFTLINTTTTLYYLRLYNLASAPTCSSATGWVASIPIPASATGAGVTVNLPTPGAFSTGIGYCFTGGASSTDNTNAATGVHGFLLYK